MGEVSDIGWGPPALVDVVRTELLERGHDTPDPARCAAGLAATQGAEARAHQFVDLGACHFLTGNVGGALAAWRQASVSGQSWPAARALYNLGLFHEEVGLLDLAVEQYQAARDHAVHPHETLAALGLARTRRVMGDRAGALDDLAELVDRLSATEPDSPMLGQALLGSGQIAEEMRDLDRAMRAYRAARRVVDEATRSVASLSLIRVLRHVGRDDEAQEVVDEMPGTTLEPTAAVDRVELLIRLGRIEEAASAVESVAGERLSIPDRFRFVAILLELGLVNRAIDHLEDLSRTEAPEPRARSVYLLGEVYLAHHMYDPARRMLESVAGVQRGYWADKAALALGDLAFALDDTRAAAAHWADAAASSVESIAAGARHRLVDAVEAVTAAASQGTALAALPTSPAFDHPRSSGGAAAIASLDDAEPTQVVVPGVELQRAAADDVSMVDRAQEPPAADPSFAQPEAADEAFGGHVALGADAADTGSGQHDAPQISVPDEHRGPSPNLAVPEPAPADELAPSHWQDPHADPSTARSVDGVSESSATPTAGSAALDPLAEPRWRDSDEPPAAPQIVSLRNRRDQRATDPVAAEMPPAVVDFSFSEPPAVSLPAGLDAWPVVRDAEAPSATIEAEIEQPGPPGAFSRFT